MTPKSPIEALQAILENPETPPAIRLLAARGLDAQNRPPVIDLATLTPQTLIDQWTQNNGRIVAE